MQTSTTPEAAARRIARLKVIIGLLWITYNLEAEVTAISA